PHSRLPAPFPQRSEQRWRDGERALREARNVEAEHRERLRAWQEQLEQLRQQEQRLHQANPTFPALPWPDRLSLAQQRRQLQQLREELSPLGPGTLLGTARERGIPADGLSIPLAPAPGARGLFPGFLPPVGMFLGGSRDSLSSSAALYGHVLLLKHRARLDHDFLENENIFMESLKKEP
ncbi:FBF1 factor, partial [Sapayoa aenigma]|nr:FBF1 factor [Sapayoa aenigma]